MIRFKTPLELGIEYTFKVVLTLLAWLGMLYTGATNYTYLFILFCILTLIGTFIVGLISPYKVD